MTSDPALPSFYVRIEKRLNRGHQSVVVRGPAGFGKSAFLARRADKLGPIIPGRDVTRALALVRELLDQAELTQDVLIDDLDSLAHEADEEVIRDLEKLFRNLGRSQRRFIATTKTKPEEIVEQKNRISPFLGTAEVVWLDREWRSDPAGRLQELVKQSLLGQLFIAGVGWQSPNNDEFQKVVASEILSLTGAHPTLVSPALEAISNSATSERPDEVLVRPRSDRTPPISMLTWGVRALLSDAITMYGLRALERRIEALRQSKSDEEREAAERLIELAEAGARGRALSRDVKRILEPQGLITSSLVGGGYYSVPGSTLRASLLKERRNGCRVEIDVDPYAPERGRVASSGRLVELGGREWEILLLLLEKDGELVSAREIGDRLQADPVTAITPAIARLRKDLKRAEVEDIVENVRGVGYRVRTEALAMI